MDLIRHKRICRLYVVVLRPNEWKILQNYKRIGGGDERREISEPVSTSSIDREILLLSFSTGDLF